MFRSLWRTLAKQSKLNEWLDGRRPRAAARRLGLEELEVRMVLQAPTITIPAQIVTSENSFATLANNALAISDAGASGPSEQVSLSVSSGRLNLSGTTGLTINDGVNGSASMTFTGTLADVNNALNGLDYTPATDFFGSDTLAVGVVNLNDSESAAASSQITVNEVNVAPTVTAPASASVNENSTITFQGNNLVSVNDFDANGNTELVTVSATNGTLTLATTNGLQFNSGANGSASMTFLGTIAELQAALNGMEYTPATNFVGSDTLAVSINDLGNSGGGALTANANVALTVNQAATHFVVSAPAGATAGTPFTVTVTAEDAANNTVAGYAGTVHFTSSAAAATLPADATLTNGSATFTVTLNTAGSQTVTATDSANALSGASGAVAVRPAPVAATAAVFDPNTGTWTQDNQGSGDASSADTTFAFGQPGDTPVIGIWDGGGYDEIGVYRVATDLTDPTTGLHPLLFSLDVNGNGQWDPDNGDVSFVFGLQGDVVVVGDWLGNGRHEVGVVRPGSDGVLVWTLNLQTGDPNNVAVDHFGLNGDEVLVGVWAGNLRTEIGTVRSAGGNLIWSLDTNGDGAFDAGDALYTFGRAGDVPMLGDWTGTGTTKIGVYRVGADGTTLNVTLDLVGDGVFAAPPDQVTSFGQAGDTMIVGDWTNSGTTKIGTYRHSTSNQQLLFALDSNGDGTFDAGDTSSQVGLAGGADAQVYVGQWKNNPR